ncbi:MAG: MFS transporter [Clostridia bacterium]|nr:MFS transporter [Clostridia bacterium]
MKDLKKTFLTIFIGQTMSLLTSAIVQYAIIWHITFKTGSAVDLAMATIAGILPQILLGPIAGVIVDRFDRKKIMMYSDGMIAVATLVLGILFLYGEPSMMGMYIVLAVRSLGSTFHSPSFTASIPMLAPKEKLVKISGINQTINSITLIIAPILAGILFGAIPLPYIIFLDIIGAIFGIGSIAMVHIPNPEKKEEKSNILLEMKQGFGEIKQSRFLLILTIYVIAICIIFMPIASMYPLITKNYFRLEAIHVSIVEVLFSIGMLVGGIAMAKEVGFRKKQYTILVAMLIFAVALIASGLIPNSMFWMFVFLTFVMGSMGPFFEGLYTVILQTKIEPQKQGRVFSIVMSFMQLATPIGLFLVAPIAEQIGVEKMFVISGILMIIATLVTISLKTIRNEE